MRRLRLSCSHYRGFGDVQLWTEGSHGKTCCRSWSIENPWHWHRDTQFKGVEVAIAGKVFPHLLFHYRLAWSGWSYTQVVQGGESFVALSEGLQNALAACGGVPARAD